MEICLEFENLTLSLPEKGLDGNKLEEIVLKAVRVHGCLAMEKVLALLDEGLMKERGKSFKSVGFKEKIINTRLGEVRLKRRYYRDQDSGFRHLLDEYLGWEKHRRSTGGFLYEALSQCSQQSYRRAKAELEKQTGVSVSHECIRQLAGKTGSAIERMQAGLTSQVFGAGEIIEPEKTAEQVFVEADGKWLSIRREGKVRKEEMKLGIFYEGWQPRYFRGKRDSFKLTGKYAFGGLYEAQDFRERLACLGERKIGLSRAQRIIWGGDGAGWCKAAVRDYPQAVYHLCVFHMHREIRRTFGPDRKSADELRELLWSGERKQASAWLDGRLRNASEKERRKRFRLRKYVLNNWEGIMGWRKVRQALGAVKHGYLGAIEGNIDKLLARRFTDRGACWSRKGAHNLVLVRLAWFNRELEKAPAGLKRKEETKDSAPERSKPGLKEFWRRGGLPSLQIAISKPWQKILKDLASGAVMV